MLPLLFQRVLEEGREDGGDNLRISRELSKLPRTSSKGRPVDAGIVKEAFLTVTLFILAQLVQALDHVALLVAVSMTHTVH